VIQLPTSTAASTVAVAVGGILDFLIIFSILSRIIDDIILFTNFLKTGGAGAM